MGLGGCQLLQTAELLYFVDNEICFMMRLEPILFWRVRFSPLIFAVGLGGCQLLQTAIFAVGLAALLIIARFFTNMLTYKRLLQYNDIIQILYSLWQNSIMGD